MTGPVWDGLKFVAFDFDGTLTDFVQADLAALEAVRQAACPDADSDAFVQRSVDEIMAFHARVEAGEADPLRQDEERLGRTLGGFGAALTQAHLALYTDTLIRHTTPMPGSVELLGRLRGRSLRLALLSNAYDGPAQRRRVAACFPDSPFDVVVIAGETGALKPDPQPFRVMLEALGLPAGAGVYIGDSPEHDVAGAQAVGLAAVHVHAQPRVRERALTLGALATFPNLHTLTEPLT